MKKENRPIPFETLLPSIYKRCETAKKLLFSFTKLTKGFYRGRKSYYV